MPFSFAQGLFLGGFNLLFLLLLLLGESFVGPWLRAALTILFLVFSFKNLEWQRVREHSKVFTLGGLWLLALFFTSFFTHSRPLTLEKITYFAFIAVGFTFFLLLKESFISKKTLINSLILQTVVISILSLIFNFIPSTAQLLPGMNLIYSSYGHNHLAALLIIMLPVSWWWAINQTQENSRNKSAPSNMINSAQALWLIPVFLTISLLFSFGRVAILLGAGQWLLLMWWFQGHFKNLKSSNRSAKFFRIIISLTSLLFAITIILKLFLSFAPLWQENFSCPIPFYQDKLCKSINLESRPFYWQQALLAIKEYPLTGYGAGTFSMINHKYRQSSWITTSAAHNAFLKQLAETGLIAGGLFFILMWWLFFEATKGNSTLNLNKLLTTKFEFNHALLLGVAAIYIDVLFDFDWNFSGIFLLTFIFLSLLLKERSSKKVKGTSLSKLLTALKVQVIKLGWWLLAALVILYVVAYGLVEILLAKGQIDQAAKYFPFVPYHQKIFTQSQELNSSNRQKIYEIYKYHSDVYPDFSPIVTNQDLLIKIDPWMALSRNPNLTEQQLKSLSGLLLKSQTLGPTWQVDGRLKTNLAQQAVVLAVKDFNQVAGNSAQLSSAADKLVLAYKLDPWVLSNLQLNFDDYNLSLSQKELLVTKLNFINGQFYGYQRQAYFELYRQVLNYELEQSNPNSETITVLLQKIEEITPWNLWNLQPEAEKIQQLANKYIEQDQFDQAEQLLKYLEELGAKQYENRMQLANFYLMRGELEKAKQEYQACANFWLETNNEEHWHCQNYQQALDDNWIDSNFYWFVSQIILGEESWK